MSTAEAAEAIPIVSNQKGHRWIQSRDPKRARWVVCADCHQAWPSWGDLAPMPVCKFAPPTPNADEE